MTSNERDAAALDELAGYLRRPAWPSGADFMEWCASIVASTGRDLENGETDEGEIVANGRYIADLDPGDPEDAAAITQHAKNL